MKGFSLVEMILVVAVFSVLTSFATVNLLRPQTGASLDGAVTTLVADFKQQQLQSMVGDTGGKAQAYPHGVHFTQTSYVLFTNPTFDPLDTRNFTVNLGSGLEFAAIPADMLFGRRSGEIVTPISVTVRHTASGETRTVTVSRVGVVGVI